MTMLSLNEINPLPTICFLFVTSVRKIKLRCQNCDLYIFCCMWMDAFSLTWFKPSASNFPIAVPQPKSLPKRTTRKLPNSSPAEWCSVSNKGKTLENCFVCLSCHTLKVNIFDSWRDKEHEETNCSWHFYKVVEVNYRSQLRHCNQQ